MPTFSDGESGSSVRTKINSVITEVEDTIGYEAGSWTPVVADASSGGNVATALSIVGVYTKIGDFVSATCTIINIDTTGLTAGNDLFIRSLPFSSASVVGINPFAWAGAVELVKISYSDQVVAQLRENESHFRLAENLSASGTGRDYVRVSEVNSGSNVITATLNYQAAT